MAEMVRDGARVYFGTATREVARLLRVLPGADPENYSPALLELSEDAPVAPLRIADTPPEAGRAVAVIGFPFKELRFHVAFAEHFAGASGKHVMWGTVIHPPEGASTFDHDCFTSVGTAGGPVLDLASGVAVGIHVAGTKPSDGRKRGTVVSLARFAEELEKQLRSS